MNAKNFLFYWLPPIAWMILVFPTNDYLNAGSTSRIIVPLLTWLMPHAGQDTIEMIHGVIRKCGHFVNYAFLAFLLLRGFRGNAKNQRLEWILYSGVIAIGYGLLDEYIQAGMPSRTGSWYDWLIDSAGVFAVLGLFTAKNRSKFFPNPSSHR